MERQTNALKLPPTKQRQQHLQQQLHYFYGKKHKRHKYRKDWTKIQEKEKQKNPTRRENNCCETLKDLNLNFNSQQQQNEREIRDRSRCRKTKASYKANEPKFRICLHPQDTTTHYSVARNSPTNIKTKSALINFHSIPLLQLLWLICCLSLAHNSMADCPSSCECKWKSGKESVLCLNANLTHIPKALDAGTQALDLSGNELITIAHDTFAAANLLNLQKVYMARCHLRTIDRYAFRKLINLVELDLSYNSLVAIPSDSFEFIPELREIKLNGNPIERVQDEAFIRVPQLVRLELTDCKLKVVETRAFAGLEVSLEWLKLDGNELKEVRSGTITSLTNLHGIELARNQWNCSCSLRPLRAWMLRQNIPYGIPPMCSAPPRLAGKSWDKVDLDDFACVPQIIATDTQAHGVEGRNVTMSCYVEGVPEPSVRWMVKNRVIANLTATGDPTTSPRTAAATQGRKTYVVNMLRNASNLTILTADMQDAGIYTCAAENKAGKVEASVTLAVSRRPPEAPLGAKIVLLCVLIALLFVIGSSLVAICLCSLRRKRKMRLWNSVPPARTESYEKIEMTTRSNGGGKGGAMGGNGNIIMGTGNRRPDLGGSSTNESVNIGAGSTSSGASSTAGMGFFHNEDNDYLRNATTPLNCGSDDGGDTGVAIVNPSGGSAKRNGDYRNVPTHCDDDSIGYEAKDNKKYNGNQSGTSAKPFSTLSRWKTTGSSGVSSSKVNNNLNLKTQSVNEKLENSLLRISPKDNKRQQFNAGNAFTNSSSTAALAVNAAASNTASISNVKSPSDEPDLHIPRLIDIGSDSASNSISSQVDAATARLRLGNNGHMSQWSPVAMTTSKVISPPPSAAATGSKRFNATDNSTFYDDISAASATYHGNSGGKHEEDLFDSNYPDLLDIAKYAINQAKSQISKANQYNAIGNASSNGLGAAIGSGSGSGSSIAAGGPVGNGALCTLPRKLKNTGKYFKDSSDSQSPLLATDNSSKYGSSTLGDASFLTELGTPGRRFSAESNYATYIGTKATYTTGQRSNSFLNLVHSTNKNRVGSPNASSLAASAAAALAAADASRNPSLPSSPVHNLAGMPLQQLQQQQHQRSLSSAATPLLDFSTLTTRAGLPSAAASVNAALHSTPTTASVAAYDYHAAQLERFLEEYRSLQDQLCKMKETCDTIRKKDVPARTPLGQSAQLADPVMFNAALAASSPTANARATTLKSKPLLPGQPPDPPPYWLHRNAMLKRLNEQSQTSSDIFKS